jgi:hypothetical protein
VTVSGAPETALIAPSACRPPPPAADGHPIAPCGIVLTASGIASPSRRFCALPLPPQPVRCIYISPASLPRTTTHFSLPFSLSCPPRPVHCPLRKMPPYPTTALIQYGALHSPLFDDSPFFSFSSGVTDGSSGRLHRKLSHFFHP